MIGVFTFTNMDEEYVELLIQFNNPGDAELIIAFFGEAGYIGFEERGNKELLAFIHSKDFDESFLNEISGKINFQYAKSIIPETNWNKDWESNFQPVLVDDYCGIRADFHEPLINVKHEIIITPKMSFGTGHHATTYMMVQCLQDLNVKYKKVFDFGTGTGVLAILAEKEGASEVLAIDHDEWSALNAAENIFRNNAKRITVVQSDNPDYHQNFDIILANINKHIIIESLPALTKQLNPSGFIICSGFMKQDMDDINTTAAKCNLISKQKRVRENWVCVILQLS
ncbi:MAG: 50S ribosomal protein L11 methyltransferase [Chitinophagaceae bacterium]|jgi:ribosomal protein L11 methyltransferase|nr:50S ribosomal protein L11 methyltransferase [Chitinophagaceae bacterium]